MSEETPKRSLNVALLKTDEQLLNNWTTFASLIMNFEEIEWKEASKIARQLISNGNALDYLSEVRSEVSKSQKVKKTKKTSVKAIPESQSNSKKETKVIPLNTKKDRFSLNFKRLLQIAPDLQDQVTSNQFASGKSKVSGYMDFNLEVIHKDRTGCYLAMSHNYIQNGDLVPDPDMRILVNFDRQTVEALSFQNAIYYREVYNDIYERTMVRTTEKKSQNAFLETWLLNLISQGHLIIWDEDEEDEPEDNTPTPVIPSPPSINEFPSDLVDKLKEKLGESTLGQAKELHRLHLDGKVEQNPLFLFLLAERINEITQSDEAQYPSQGDLDAYRKLNFSSVAASKAALKLEVDKMEEFIDGKPNISFMDETVISEIRSSFSEGILDDLINLYLKHQQGTQPLRSVALYFVVDRLNTGPLGISVPYPSSEDLHTDYDALVKMKEKNEDIEQKIEQMLTEKDKEKVESEAKKVVSELIDETESTTKKSLNVKTLAYFIEQTEGLSKDEAEKKALKLKNDGKSKRYITENFTRQTTINKNQILKLNYQKLFRLVPDLLITIQSEVRDIEHMQSGSLITVVATEDLGKYQRAFMISDQSGNPETWIVLVEKGKRKATVTGIENSPRDKKRGLDDPFGEWLDQRLERKRPAKKVIERAKAPIVIEWAEGSDDKEVGFNSLEELHERLRSYFTVQEPDMGYNKVKVRFEGLGDVRIDLSVTKGDFNPATMDLEDYLDEIEPSIDWSKFSHEVDPKRLQIKADRMPTFEVGKVELTKEHIRAGLTQKDINWINKHQQGIVITPKKKMKNNTTDYFSDVYQQAMKPGKRVSNTGRIYYESRSNRADLTNKGL